MSMTVWFGMCSEVALRWHHTSSTFLSSSPIDRLLQPVQINNYNLFTVAIAACANITIYLLLPLQPVQTRVEPTRWSDQCS